MDGFLKHRAADPRFTNERRVTGVQNDASAWYTTHNNQPDAGIVRSRYIFAEEKKKESASDHDSASSESDGEGGRQKKKKGRCWEGYEPTPGKEPYSDGSCRKK